MKEIIISYEKYKDKTLMEALAAEGFGTQGSCGGMGACGKCSVIANGRSVLACQHKVTEDLTVVVSEAGEDVSLKESATELPENLQLEPAEEGTYGIALDLGTTTVVVMFWDLSKGQLVDVKAVTNPQKHYGADVMSRIGFAMRAPWNLTRLQSSLINEINRVISEFMMVHDIKLGQIRKIVAVGNTTMSHLFLGEDVSGLGSHPFAPAFTGGVTTTAKMVGIAAHEEAEVYVGPNMAGHVGSDITAGILASGYMESGSSAKRLFLDIGTNGEIFLTDGRQAWCCSAAAGPAFEGSALHQGMRAADGAICRVDLLDGTMEIETIGNVPAKGICGSGIIDALAVLLKMGKMDHFGTIEENFVLAVETEDLPAVVITQQDVREVQMAKAAISAGCKTLLEGAALSLDDLDEIGIAGTFGNAVRVESGVTIGLLPKTDAERFRSLGNAAGVGASMLLLSKVCREDAERIASSVKHVELAASESFQKNYIEAMNF